MDSSGDGAINFDEFSKLVASPKLKFWMSQLELEYHDLLSLFEFLDNGTGQITLTEFIDGAAKLRGSAKAIDIWRIETKVELLFEEVLSSLASASHHGLRGGKSSTVEDAFANSDFRHIKSTRHARQSGGELAAALDANGTGSGGLTDL
ncbi:Catsper1 [Symbiodinium natans]|uniref:Catsper1 protein n=1 Tax=Symbiodinium natans TaxID=878477 RepID=A0A812T7H7_9DINO|nr:Catsper1 [Symbiodinium natans]